ncbi:fused PTS fructose transporter subunit IIA/HPr protein [Ursidibacter maritimus]|uniref:Multiphosphoryl transfer protein n=1 Tax=Ursidibacter maritimus TaxID=1331689 RepID=A0A949T3E6_9PAST|nr:fused PTS fructose transporter subunit IIA/HPr protein [Ursidibacter maritimus]KAE9541951.1 PTS fructose transporter subunit IIA [Ursidibacter maritimus]MBV6523247.1 fused PTS fructose transporter subunit IIA/HPr protein [Ursidibacter maritimus]MBV6525703.1 fused PTS fructose transporter subunit IIA/HPr protein [Ursidibacter maritimus]MBV6527401.1 fused PTS fructose transporter subunit IIA/HPr protein [Ursidibacter maritimus]MBV6529426.1 fused PTS fructose transporter subunit IIA/HPr protei
MLNLSAQNIRLNNVVSNKEEAIRLVAQGLVNNGNVAEGYETGMLARETQTSTFLGNGIAIPHGTLDTRHLVQQTGVQVLQFPNGVEWGEGNTAYVVIGIAAKSDEHLSLLRQLTTVLGNEETAEKLAKTQDLAEFIALLSGKRSEPVLSAELLSLNIESTSLITLSAINAAKLQEKGYVNQSFISDVLATTPLNLGNNVFLADSAKGNQLNGIAVARNQVGKTLITVSVIDESLNPQLAKLTQIAVRQKLTIAPIEQILNLFGIESQAHSANEYATAANSSQDQTACAGQIVATFTVRNEHGLHARPCAVLVQTLKPFEAKVTVENLDRPVAPVNAKSTMRVVALGATKAHRLRFVAEGVDAQQALEALGKAFAEGLGENVSFEPPVADVIESGNAPLVQVENSVQADSSVQNSANPTVESTPVNTGELEATFTIKNEHGLHARPCAILVNEVKKYNATIQVQNLDRDTQLVSAKSLMKIVALGVQKGHRLRFVATGEEAQKALDGIGAAIEAGLGE